MRGDLAALKTRLLRFVAPHVSRVGGGAPWLAGIGVALVGALVAYAVAIIPVLVVWMSSPTSGLTFLQTLRVSGLLWLVGEGTPIDISGATYSLTPWGMAVIPIAALVLSSRVMARRMPGLQARVWLVLATAVTYGGIVAAVGFAVSSDDASVPFLISGIFGAVISSIACSAGVFTDGWKRLPVIVQGGLRASVVALCSLVAVGSLAVAASLVVHIDDAISIAQALNVGVLGGIGVLFVSLAYVPVIIVWSISYVLGAGIVLGPQVMASPFVPVMAPAPLPPLPLLASIPQQAAPVLSGLPVLGVLAGVLAGWYLGRRMRGSTWSQRLAAAGITSAVVAAVLGLCAVAASGSLGGVRFAHLGPPSGVLAGIGLLVTFVGAAPVAMFAVPRRRVPVIVPVPDRASVVLVDPEHKHEVFVDPDATVGMAPIVMDDEPTVGMAPIVIDDDPTVGMTPIVDLDATAEIAAIDMAQSSHE